MNQYPLLLKHVFNSTFLLLLLCDQVSDHFSDRGLQLVDLLRLLLFSALVVGLLYVALFCDLFDNLIREEGPLLGGSLRCEKLVSDQLYLLLNVRELRYWVSLLAVVQRYQALGQTVNA